MQSPQDPLMRLWEPPQNSQIHPLKPYEFFQEHNPYMNQLQSFIHQNERSLSHLPYPSFLSCNNSCCTCQQENQISNLLNQKRAVEKAMFERIRHYEQSLISQMMMLDMQLAGINQSHQNPSFQCASASQNNQISQFSISSVSSSPKTLIQKIEDPPTFQLQDGDSSKILYPSNKNFESICREKNNQLHIKKEQDEGDNCVQQQQQISPDSAINTQKSASFRSQDFKKDRNIKLIINGTERESQINHSVYLNLVQFMKNKNIIHHFTSILSNSSISPSSSIELIEYERMIKQRFSQIEDEGYNKSKGSEQIVQVVEESILRLMRSRMNELEIVNSVQLKPQKQYEIYSNLQKMCQTFVRGDKKKRFKQRNPSSQYMSQFHNLNRLFFYQIMSIYSYESLSCFSIDPLLSEQLRNAISSIKIHSKLRIIKKSQINSDIGSKKRRNNFSEDEQSACKKQLKPNESGDSEDNIRYDDSRWNNSNDNFYYGESDDDSENDFPIRKYMKYFKTVKVENYTHSHYNTLFLKLTPESITQLSKHQKDVESHWLSYKIDLRKGDQISEHKLRFVNLLKQIFYKIFVHFNDVTLQNKENHFQDIMNLFKQDEQTDPLKLRLNYYHRVVLGIHKLNSGLYMHKF